MSRRPPILAPCSLLLALTACGEPATNPANPRYELQTPATEPDAATLTVQLRGNKAPLLLFAHDDATIVTAAASRRDSAQAQIKIVGTPGNGSLARLDDDSADAVVTVSIDALATASIEFCLLAVSGITPPPQVAIGARWFTRANRAAGGQALPSPGEFALATMRQQHAEVLTQTPKTDVVFRVGLVIATRDERSARLATALASKSREYPQLHLRLGNDPAEFLAENVNALLVAGASTPGLVAACEEAMNRGIKVVGVGSDLPAKAMVASLTIDEDSLGRAAAEAIAAMLPAGGTVLELGYRSGDPARVACRNSLAAALAARQPK
ncbi:MAG: substrate-binding domain-containing protein [Planctomycetes bacterium]|nr:substrate-binding domain-containing protein [Planctomycetota bacterium]MCB9884673.1 substrate-binding domain-containing protein [Planctomycetota bacterium]